MPIIPKEIQRLFRRVRDLFIMIVFPNSGVLKVKFFRFVVGGVRSGEFDFSDLVSRGDMNEFYRSFRGIRDRYVEENLEDILDRIGETVPADELKRLPEFLIDFFAAKERFLNELTNLASFMELPADIRLEMFESSKALREKMLERLIPIVMQELGVDDERIRDLARDTAGKRKFYIEMLFPRVAGNVRSVGLRFDEALVWRKADELVESIAEGKLSLAG